MLRSIRQTRPRWLRLFEMRPRAMALTSSSSVRKNTLFLSFPKCRTPTFARCPKFDSKKQQNIPQDVQNLIRKGKKTSPKDAFCFFEGVGRRETMDACVGWAGALGRRGRLVLVGYTQGDAHDFRCHPIPMIVFEQSILGSVGEEREREGEGEGEREREREREAQAHRQRQRQREGERCVSSSCLFRNRRFSFSLPLNPQVPRSPTWRNRSLWWRAAPCCRCSTARCPSPDSKRGSIRSSKDGVSGRWSASHVETIKIKTGPFVGELLLPPCEA